MIEFIKKHKENIIIIFFTFVLAGAAIWTAIRLYQLRTTAPTDSSASQQNTIITCTELIIPLDQGSTASPSPTGSSIASPTGTATPTDSSSPTATPTNTGASTATSTATPTPTNSSSSTATPTSSISANTTATPTNTGASTATSNSNDDNGSTTQATDNTGIGSETNELPEAGFGLPTIVSIGAAALILVAALVLAL